MSMSFTTTAILRPSNPGAAVAASTIVAIGGFLLLAAAVASGAPEGIWSSALIVGAAVPLRHSLEPSPAGTDTSAVVRRHPLLLALALAMTTAGALLGILLSN